MYTTPPVTAFIVPTVVGMLIPDWLLSVYDKAEVTSPAADPVNDAKIQRQKRAP